MVKLAIIPVIRDSLSFTINFSFIIQKTLKMQTSLSLNDQIKSILVIVI